MKIKILKRNFISNKNQPTFESLNLGRYILNVNPIYYGWEKFLSKSNLEPKKLNAIFRKKSNGEKIGYGEDPLGVYLYKNTLYGIDTNKYYGKEIELMIKEHYYKHDEKFKKLQKEIELFESSDKNIKKSSREPIPEKVRFSVWRRDEGKCVKCGSNKGIEFDHIIPFSKGGSNTERNLQLLCEKCNRQKSSKI